MTNLVKQHLNRVPAQMKHHANKGRSKQEFVVGDLMFFKLQPYV
jgi:hypothetical protein